MSQDRGGHSNLAAGNAWAAGPVGYLLLVLPAAKLARGIELALRAGSLEPLSLLPASVGQDLLLLGALGLVFSLLARLHRPRVRTATILLLLLPIALLLPCDVLSHKLTGRPLTLHRLLGGEGATLADGNLLAPADLIGVSVGMLVAVGMLWPALRHAWRPSWLLGFSRPRPQAITLLLGGALALAQSAFLPRAEELSDQPVFALAGSVFESAGLQARAADAATFRRLLEPGVALAPPPSLPAIRSEPPPRNVVVFVGEGIPFKATGFDPRFKGSTNPTPNLTQRVARDGLVFDRYYATWHASIQAIFSIVCSMFPPMSGDIVRIKRRIDCGEFSEVMRSRGVLPGLFHSGQFSFYNKLALLGRRAYATELDASELAKTSPRKSHEWGIDDRAMVDATLQWVDGLPKQQRFAALMIAVSPHYPYWLPPDFKPPFQDNSREHQFLNGVNFVDSAFEQLLRGFEARGLYDDTLFVWLGDHGHYVGEPLRETPGVRQFYEPNLRTPLVLLSRRMFPKALAAAERINSRVGSHIDLLPTLLHALGTEPDPRHQGLSLLTPALPSRRVFFGATDGRYVGFYEGTHKFVARTRRKGSEYYDLASDPDELRNLSAKHPERAKRYAEASLRFASASEARIAATPLLREDVSVSKIYELFMADVAVRATRISAPPCAGGPELDCPDLGRVLRVETKQLQGDRRRCVMARVPRDGTLELQVDDPKTLELMTGTTLAMRDAKSRDAVAVEIAVDGQLQPSLELNTSAAARPRHPRPSRELRLRFTPTDARTSLGRPSAAGLEVCIQLTNLFSR